MRNLFSTLALIVAITLLGACKNQVDYTIKIDDQERAQQIKEMKYGMFICWSYSTFSGEEWTKTLDKDASYFKATGCDTDQWCQVAKDAGMGYILFLTKHHDGFCLWDTETTEKRVTNSELEIDVLKKLSRSCEKYGIKLALYFSEGDWNWPGAIDGGSSQIGINPEMKKAQLKELCTEYGPIEFFWMDHAAGDGGLSHKETTEFIHQFQPNCFIGYNHGEPSGRLSLRERGSAGEVGDSSASKYNKEAEANYSEYLVAEFTYPILPEHEGGADWFYSLPKHDNLCKAAEHLYIDYEKAVDFGNIFSINIGPNYEGRIRDIDVKTLSKVGEYIKESDKPSASKPNVIVLFTDDQRYGTASALGCSELKTPNIDRLINSGVSFNNAYILGAPHAAVCSPSRAMLMTGKNYFSIPGNVHTQWAYPNEERGKCDIMTFPEYFRANGYNTFATGKQHNGKDWIERGFTSGKSLFLGGMSGHFGLSVKDYSTTEGWGETYRDKQKYSSELFADAAVEFLSLEKQENPFLMYVAFTAPHDPRTAPDEYHAMYTKDDVTLPPNFMPEHPFLIGDSRIRDELLADFPRTKGETKQHLANYYAMIAATDYSIGRIVDALEKSGYKENTIIVFAGDNGLAVGQHGLMGKQSVYEHSMKVPFVFSGKGIPKGEKRDAFVYLHDFFPTICDLAGLEAPVGVDTESVVPIINDKEESVRESILLTYQAYKNAHHDKIRQHGAHRAIRRGDYKLILSVSGDVVTPLLFNLKDDPFELNNLIDEPGMQKRALELKEEMLKLMREANDSADLEAVDFGLYPENSDKGTIVE